MRLHKNTNRQYSWPVLIVVCPLIVIVTLAVKLWPRTVPFDQCSAIYRHYAGIEGVDASFIKDFRVNDSVFIDVTLLEAKDSAGWATLMHDFAVPEPNAELQAFIDNGEDLIFSQALTPSHYPISIPSDSILFGVLATSYYAHTLTIIHAKNESDVLSTLHRNYKESIIIK